MNRSSRREWQYAPLIDLLTRTSDKGANDLLDLIDRTKAKLRADEVVDSLAYYLKDRSERRIHRCAWCKKWYVQAKQGGLTCSDSCSASLSRSRAKKKDEGEFLEKERERQRRFRARRKANK
jgi:hypothetical protein